MMRVRVGPVFSSDQFLNDVTNAEAAIRHMLITRAVREGFTVYPNAALQRTDLNAVDPLNMEHDPAWRWAYTLTRMDADNLSLDHQRTLRHTP